MANYLNEEDLRHELINVKYKRKIQTLRRSIEDGSALDPVLTQEELDSILVRGYTEEYSANKLGEMIVMIINRFATKSSYGGYSNNWKDDLIGNALDRSLMYLTSFDENRISKRNVGQTTKAFSWLTEICKRAFWQILNEKKAHQAFLENNTLTLSEAFGTKKQRREKDIKEYKEDLF